MTFTLSSSPRAAVLDLLGEVLVADERVIVSPVAGRFEPAPMDIPSFIDVGTAVGVVAGSPVESPFAGELVGVLALPGERLRVGQPIAWIRTMPTQPQRPRRLLPMTDDKAFEMFRSCAVEVLQVDPDLVRFDARFGDDLEADSLDLLELALAVEEAFGIRMVEDELRDIETVEQAFALVRGKL